jgi:hypothetical protein
MSSVQKTSFEIEDPYEPEPEPLIKHKALFGLFAISTIVAPYVTGAIILTQKTKLEDWGWI